MDRLAVGGMAEVFVAVARGSDGFEKAVVIKRLLPHLARLPRFQQMFLDEARITLSLQHGNIVQILDMGRMDGLPFLALEYVDGKDLRTVMRRASDMAKSIPHGLIAYVASEVCRALDYAHRKKDEQGQPLHVVHRDVNPANIFLSHEGVVKVGDFGLAKARDNLDQSEAGIIKGKFSYLSPEQAHGEPIDHRSDIFSLGTTIYELTCGKRPFVGDSDVAVVMKVREAHFTPPSELVNGFDPDLEAVILKAMQKDPDQRYGTASQMRQDLTRYLQKLPTAPGEGELTDFLDSLFAVERRSNSTLIRLAPIGTLPPPMTSVSHAGGLSEYQQQQPHGPPTPTSPATPGSGSARQVVMSPTTPVRPRQSRMGLLIMLLAVIVAAAASAGAVIYKALKKDSASLRITSTPSNATVMLDGRDTGKRTPARLDNLVPGKEYLVAVRHPETEQAQRAFRFDEPGSHSYEFTLSYVKEALSVESDPPRCDVLVNGELRGQTPLTVYLERDKKHAIELRKKEFLAKTFMHHADRKQSTLKFHLEPAPVKTHKGVRRGPRLPVRRTPVAKAGMAGNGVLEIDTNIKASVFIDKRYVGKTPNFRMILPAGQYFVLVNPEGTNIRHQAQIQIVARQTHRLRLTPPK